MNRTLWKLAVVIVVLVIVTAVGLLRRGSTGSEAAAQVARADEQVSHAAPPTDADPKTGDKPKTPAERRPLLEAVGALTAAHCFQTYFNIGLLADGKAKGTYTDKDVHQVLDSILALVSSVDRKLAALDQIDLEKQDRDSLEQMRLLSALLRQQGKELQNFWDSGKDEDAAKYESARKDSWAAISKLTGLGR